MQALFMNYGQTLSQVESADFDGSADYMTRGADLTGTSDGKQGTVMFWFRIDATVANMTIITNATTLAGATSRWRVRKVAGGEIDILGLNAAGTTILDIQTSDTYDVSTTWFQFLSSWNLATGTAHLYVNDVSVLTSTTLTDDSIDYTVADWAIGGQANAGTLFNGCLAEVYFSLQYLDLSIVANRRRFISGNGKPVWLGTDGAIPTGTAPIVYQRIADGAAADTFDTNLGTGGDFTITGTLDLGSSTPSG